MSPPLKPHPRAGMPPRRWWVLLVVFLFSACATGHPPGGMLTGRMRPLSLTPPPAPREAPTSEPDLEGAVVYEVAVLEPGRGTTRPVPVARVDFQRAVHRIAREVQHHGRSPREAAREWLKGQVEQHLEERQLSGTWVAEVYKGRVLSLVPVDEDNRLAPEADADLRDKYLLWCTRAWGGGDCLRLFDDGPSLRTDDRRTLALALAFGSVLEETKAALGRELSPQVLMASCMWTLGTYMALWLVPEPTTKLLAAGLSVVLVAWLGVDTLWGLMDGWATMATRAHEASTFGELREAGEGFGRVLGTDAARAMILAVGALTGRTLGEVAARVRALPGYGLASVQWQVQGGAAVLGRLEVMAAQEGVLARAVVAVETVAATPHGPISVVMLKKGQGGGTSSGGGSRGTVVIRHRSGNLQVILPNGQRWHLPPGFSIHDIPLSDPLGDKLQSATNRIAKKWGPSQLTIAEQEAIDMARRAGNHFQASRLEGQARGRWVEAQLRELFKHLKWNHQGVDITGPTGQKYHYEVLAGSADNFGRHGRRMPDIFFRMIFF